ncbi:hypothetical protein M23134_06698 [Microscilla marina ATCC 23134]|uniref:Uncharacterized protein n=1 Tax=Microscilla marina ATCC 23134 TaxID=313606 RepID=A1ZXM8_MICM2|nr:hypothetical protein M23134_06698 [Microscilla marina ATCC 23134]
MVISSFLFQYINHSSVHFIQYFAWIGFSLLLYHLVEQVITNQAHKRPWYPVSGTVYHCQYVLMPDQSKVIKIATDNVTGFIKNKVMRQKIANFLRGRQYDRLNMTGISKTIDNAFILIFNQVFVALQSPVFQCNLLVFALYFFGFMGKHLARYSLFTVVAVQHKSQHNDQKRNTNKRIA